METSTEEEPSKEGRKRTRESGILVQYARKNVGSPSNFSRKRRSHGRYTSYMVVMTELLDIETSSF